MEQYQPVDGDPFAASAVSLQPVQGDPFAAGSVNPQITPQGSMPYDLQGQSIAAYNPTWREKAAQWLYGDQPRSPEAEATIRGLTGTTGLGTPRMSVSDLTPVGGVFAAQEATRRGDYSGAGIAAMSVLPGAGVIDRGITEGVGAIERGAGEAVLGSGPMRYLHGTTADNIPSIKQNWLQPQVGAYTTKFASDELEHEPAVFLSGADDPKRALSSIRGQVGQKLGKMPSDVTPQDIADHGALVVSRGDPYDVYHLDQDGRAINQKGGYTDQIPPQAEPGDYFSMSDVQPSGVMRGARLTSFLQGHGLLPPDASLPGGLKTQPVTGDPFTQ